MQILPTLLMQNLTDKVGRKYNKQEIEKILARQNYILYGTLDFDNLALDRISYSHFFKDVEFKGNDLYGTLQISNSSDGKFLKQIIKNDLIATTIISVGTPILVGDDTVVTNIRNLYINLIAADILNND